MAKRRLIGIEGGVEFWVLAGGCAILRKMVGDAVTINRHVNPELIACWVKVRSICISK